LKIKFSILASLLLVNISCVENVITIQIFPDGQTHLKIVSIGDSTDIMDQDFQHPFYNDNNSSYKIYKTDSIWKAVTNIVIKDSSFSYKPRNGLAFNFHLNYSAKSISNIYKFQMNLEGRNIKNEYPLLYNAITSHKLDSLIWLPEALTIIIDKALSNLEKNMISDNIKIERPRLVNHFKNSFSRVSTFEMLEEIQKNRDIYIRNTLKPFKVSQKFSDNLSRAMKVHEDRLKASLGLQDDNFVIKLLLPGEPISGNAMSMDKDTLIWKFGIDSLLNENYDLHAASVITSKDKIQKNSILVIFALLMISIILLNRRR